MCLFRPYSELCNRALFLDRIILLLISLASRLQEYMNNEKHRHLLEKNIYEKKLEEKGLPEKDGEVRN